MRIFQHPVHPLLIHFPTALLPMEVVLLLLYRHYGTTSFYDASFYCLCGGVAGGAAALISGLIDSVGVARANRASLPTLLYHAALNGTVLLAYGVLLGKVARPFPQPLLADARGLVLRGVLLLLLFVGNWLGGRLIYHYGAGIKKTSL